MLLFLTILLCVYSVTAVVPFIDEGNRAKFFELTDDEIPTFKVIIPEEEYEHIIKISQVVNPWNNVDWDNFDFDNWDEQKGKEEYGGEHGEKFKTKNATMIVEMNGEQKKFNKITFSLGGNSARYYGRQAFNLKIRGNDDLYGRSQFRIRSDSRDPTLLRSKLASDIHNALGLVSISANFINLYINDHDLGVYVILDAVKTSWAKLAFDDENSTHVYQCKESNCYLEYDNSITGCINEDSDITDTTEWGEFLTILDKAQSAEDIEDIFDVDQFLYEMAYEYLAGSWDHYTYNGHNYNVYKNKKNGKWTMIFYDFDADLGQDIHFIEVYPMSTQKKDFPGYSFEEWYVMPHHLMEILITKDPTRFNNILKTLVTKVFNPATLFPHIDRLKNLIRPSIKKQKTPDENGNYIGLINKIGYDHSFEHWEANSEFTTVSDGDMSRAYGIKYWILMKYRYICNHYEGLECDPVYMDENYQFPIDKNVEASFDDYTPYQQLNNPNPEPTPDQKKGTQQCWSELLGYPCCDPKINVIYNEDEYGQWGYDFEKKEWCGLSAYTEPNSVDSCWSDELGYPCCKGCGIITTDDNGSWGYENEVWCGIPSFCS